MSRYMSSKHAALVPYVPGEQPRILGRLIKLNTNENPYPPHASVIAAAAAAAADCRLYSDPECLELRKKLAETYGVDKDEVICANSSDESLDLCFLTFCDETRPAVFPDVTYGFYKVYCDLYHIPYTEIPLTEAYTVNVQDYIGIGRNIFIANPNAPTGISLGRAEIEKIVQSNPDNIVVVDEAYVDFGGESCVDLIHRYDNLIVTMTYSKSRSMAGARLGFAIAARPLIADMNTVRNSRNPYNVNRMTLAAGIATLNEPEYTRENCARIVTTREYMRKELEALGFHVLPSAANFLFVRHEKISGLALYERLKERGIFIRHFETARLRDFNRVTVGTQEQVRIFLENVKEILA